MIRFAPGLSGFALVALLAVAPAAADDMADEATYSSYHRAIRAAELCENRVFDQDDHAKMAQVIDEKIHYALGAGKRLTLIERAKSEWRANRAASYAKRYAAKEACSKALGTGFRRGVYWRDMGVVNLPGGKPTMELTGGAQRRLAEMVPYGMMAQIDVTITDEHPMAQVIVIISAVGPPPPVPGPY